MNKQTFFLFTLGCKINQYETQALREAWQKRGWSEAEQAEKAGIICLKSLGVSARDV